MLKHKIQLKRELLKRKFFFKNLFLKKIQKFLIKSSLLKSSNRLFCFFNKQKKHKKYSISYNTSICKRTGHFKSKINYVNLSRFEFKKLANNNNLSGLKKKSF